MLEDWKKTVNKIEKSSKMSKNKKKTIKILKNHQKC